MGPKTCCWQRWKWEIVWKRGRQKDSSRRGVTFESWALGALRSREHLEGLSVHAQTRENAPSLAAFAVAGTPWERPTGRQTFLIASHKQDPRTCVPTHIHINLQSCKQKIILLRISCTVLPRFLNQVAPKYLHVFQAFASQSVVQCLVCEEMITSLTLQPAPVCLANLFKINPFHRNIDICKTNSEHIEVSVTNTPHMQRCTSKNTQQTDGPTHVQIS